MKIGAHYLGNGECEFIVWAPKPQTMAIQIVSPEPQTIALKPQENGYWHAIAQDVYPNACYRYRLNEEETHPDPASRFQPDGVHGASQVIDLQFQWTDQAWKGQPLESLILYELHVGTFTAEGTFAAIIPRLKELKETGINAIEIMPIAQFPGDQNAASEVAYRNWGYDGVYPFAVQNSYGTPQDLMQLVDACHQHGISVVLDVVYNHFGSEGNYMNHFAPYFTETYQTPWGSAMNFDDAYSQEVRSYFINNALYWLRDFHIDALRLDAVQAIYDLGAKHFLQELTEAVDSLSQATGKKHYLIAESDLNNPILIRPIEAYGYGLDAQWSDDFHHALHVLITGDQQGYYQDFGRCADLAKAYEDTFVYDWKYAPHRHRFHGASCRDRSPTQFVVCIQNHDQIGNQMLGERLLPRTSFEHVKLAAGAVLLSPNIPLLFMGEEYGETAPFTYFVSHSDPELIQAVRQGRRKEFEAFHYEGEPPDPEAVETFLKCKLNWQLRQQGQHQTLLNWYRTLIQLRQTHPALLQRDRDFIRAWSDEEKRVLVLHRWCETSELVCVMNFNSISVSLTLPMQEDIQKILDSSDQAWTGPGSKSPTTLSPEQALNIQATSLVVYERKPV
ncbi:MAG: malto-oligosyltrehalose trehalohydrolase [Oscillatoriales cyanobacterium C42_A2020_001]|nr:malto-oligosyltrehalose trehalohydrolase [Leptolyngbyaceae cyanobacterium C42_A2020_001]